jgi:hypothetical protein
LERSKRAFSHVERIETRRKENGKDNLNGEVQFVKVIDSSERERGGRSKHTEVGRTRKHYSLEVS